MKGIPSPDIIRTLLLSETMKSVRSNHAKYVNYAGNLTHLTTKKETLELAQKLSTYFIMVETDLTRAIKAIDNIDLHTLSSINQTKSYEPLLVTLNRCNTYSNYPFANEKPKNVTKVLLDYEKAFVEVYEKNFNSNASTPEKVKDTYLQNRIKV